MGPADHSFRHVASRKKNENVLGYYRNLCSLRCGNEYCVEISTLVWEKKKFPLQLKPISITQLKLHVIGSCKVKETNQCTAVASEPYTARHSPPNWEGRLIEIGFNQRGKK